MQNQSHNIDGGRLKTHIPFMILVAAVAVYANTLFLGFVWDDIAQIVNNPDLNRPLTLTEFFRGPAHGSLSVYYRPVFALSLKLDHLIWGGLPFGYHLTNVLLHGLVSCLVLIVAYKILRDVVSASFAGLIFALHPVHAEAVAYVSARNELLCALFLLLSFYGYLLYRAQGPRRPKSLLIFCGIAYLLAVLSKETAIVVPALIAVHEFVFPRSREDRSTGIIFSFLAVSGLYLYMRFSALESPLGDDYPLVWRLATTSEIMIHDLRHLFFPFDLHPFYNLPVFRTFVESEALLYAIGFAVTVALFFYSRRYSRRMFFCFFWILITLLPVSGLVSLIYPALIADRYLYVPSVGYAMAVGLVYAYVWEHAKKTRYRTILRITWVCVNLFFFVMVFQKNHIWQNDLSLWTEAAKSAPANMYVLDKLALACEEKGDFRRAEQIRKQMIVIDTDNPQNHVKLANLYRKSRATWHLAEEIYADIAERYPEYHYTYIETAMLRIDQGRMAEAAALLERSLALQDDPALRELAGDLFLRTGFTAQAALHYLDLVRRFPERFDLIEDAAAACRADKAEAAAAALLEAAERVRNGHRLDETEWRRLFALLPYRMTIP